MFNSTIACRHHLRFAADALSVRDIPAAYEALRLALAEANRAKLGCRGHILRALGHCRRGMPVVVSAHVQG